MRIRVLTRTQAICLALSLFLAIFALGFLSGLLFSSPNTKANDLVAVFAPIENTPSDLDLPPDTPLPSVQIPEINLFALSTPTPVLSPTPSVAQMPTLTPLPSATPVSGPGEFKIEVIRGPHASGGEGKKRILIYHTHTYEAYKPTPESTYVPTEKWRTKDENCNVVRVGGELAALLTASGYEVVHDTTAYEPPRLDTSYERSLKMLEDTKARGDKFDLYIDLHRNAYSSGMAGHNTVNVGDQNIARLFMLIGKGTGYNEKPDWESNLAIATAITDALNEQVTEICLPVNLKTAHRYNQHIAPCCILIEVGNNENTLQEALNSIPYLSDAIRSALNDDSSEE